MPRTVYCEKLKVEAEGLNFAPYPGELGKRIYEHISKQAWAQWLAHQTMLINENRLSPLDPKARKYSKARWKNSCSATAPPHRQVMFRRKPDCPAPLSLSPSQASCSHP